jgi:predicted DNA-binding transcriptional regulator AlpA
MKKPATKSVIVMNASQRMSRADVAAHFDRSLPWVDQASKKGLIPPPVRIGAPFWILSSVVAWTARLVQEAEASALMAA